MEEHGFNGATFNIELMIPGKNKKVFQLTGALNNKGHNILIR